MRTHTLWPSLAIGTLAACQPAFGAYTHLSTQLHQSVTIEGADYDVWRVYAYFSHSADRLVFVGGSNNLGPMVIESRNGDDSGPGDPFFNHDLGGWRAPTQAIVNVAPDVQWDTFSTIGVTIGDQAPYGDYTASSPGFTEIAGSTYFQPNGAWYAIPTIDHDNNPGTPDIHNPQAVASWLGDGDPLNRVLLMQLTVPADGNVRGVVGIAFFDGTGGPGQPVLQQGFQSFNSFIPSPGSLGLLGVCALLSRRRRNR